MNGVSLNGVSLSGNNGWAWLEGSMLAASGSDGRVLRGSDLVGAVFAGQDDLGGSVALRVDGVATADSDLYVYDVSVEVNGGWASLCGANVGAIALAGRWDYRKGVTGGGSKISDPDSFTFACQGYVLAKCAQLGYRPWGSSALEAHHQACTRLMRADYCGDGRSFTKDGTLINLYDAIGVQEDTEGWGIEAEWDEQGARCLSHKRIGGGAPTCGGKLSSDGCGDVAHFSTGTLLMSEYSGE